MEPTRKKEAYRFSCRTLIGNWLEDVSMLQVNIKYTQKINVIGKTNFKIGVHRRNRPAFRIV